ncbi:DEAD/DEAH box helicase [Pseudofrankia sp. DC12]|uniref:DEAD/DEAH box helicase n=1 Tax=Pseudofrankia sp. DC12 TaxID=683315 RepID=UPI0005F85B2C|nr:DEAD/DEAH box helicase [Pseudofrankia sp. DC12]
MLVVHAVGTAADGVWLWAEDTRRRGEAFPADDGRHPFAAAGSDLAPLVTGPPAGAGGGPATRRTGARGSAAGAARCALLLPTTATGPAASPELAAALAEAGPAPAGPEAAGRSPVLRRWLVDAVRPSLPLTFGSGEAVRLGASALFLLAVDGFAADLVDRGRVLPAVAGDGAEPLACWLPVRTGPDAERFDELGAAMPPSFRAAPDGDAAGTNPARALSAALDALVDAHARDRLRRAARLPNDQNPKTSAPKTSAPKTPAPKARGPRRSGLVGATAGWLRALDGDPRLTAAGAPIGELAAKVAAWRAGGARPWPTRVCFRLGEPGALSRTAPGDVDAWRVDFLLQAVADPGVQVLAGEVWARRPAGPTSWATDAEESLLAGLGRAVAVWPGLGRALREARPTGLDLDLDQAREFLRLTGALGQEGFGVLVPSWWTRPARPASRLTVRAVHPVAPVLRDVTTDLDRIVDFRWAVSLGDVELTDAELDSLAAAEAELVKVRGRWTRVSPGQLASVDLARQSAGGQLTVRDVLAQTGLFPSAGEASDGEVEVVADGWLGALLAGAAGELCPADAGQARAGLTPVGLPAGLGVRLRPYQEHGLAWLALLDRLGVGAVLADDMGLGKTIQVLALELLSRAGARREPTLVICPTSVLGNWRREAEQVAPGLTVHTHHAGGGGRPLAEAASRHDLVLTTYTQLARDIEEFRPVGWDRLVLDEAQQIKNAATAQARAVRRLSARHRIALTGTPVENRLGDLWSIMRAVNPSLLGSASLFHARYAVPIERYGDPDATARLRARIRPVVLRRVKTDPAVLRDLPAKVELRQLCTLTAEQASLYRAVVDDMMERLRDASSPVRRNGVVLAAMTRLKQVCNHPAHLLGDGSALSGRSGKLARLEDLLAQVVASGDRALCFTQFARFGAMLAPYLSTRLGVEVSFLHGGLRAAERDVLVERFQTEAGPGVFLLSLKAGGTGVNLTAANHVVHVDRWWNPAVEAQATDRAHRIGQRRDVWVRTLLCMGTLEERIDRILVDKAALARTVVGGGESWLASLNTDELRDLVALAPEAVDG